MNTQKGFSLIEMLVAMAVGLMVLGAITAAIVMGQQSSGAIEMKVSSTQDARAALEIMAAEVRMASFNPNFASGIWKASDCSAAATQANKGLQRATDASITVEMDLDESGIVGDSANEIISYDYDVNEQRITRTVNDAASCGAAASFLGDTAGSGLPRTVRVVNSDAGIPVFRYYDGAGVELTSPVSSVTSIRRVEVTLVVETDQNSPMTKNKIRSIYKTSIIPRNHAISS